MIQRKKAHPQMRLQNTPDAFPTASAVSIECTSPQFPGMDTVCYAPPASYSVLPRHARSDVSEGSPMRQVHQQLTRKTSLQNSIAGAANAGCRFSEARTLAALGAVSKHFFRAKPTYFLAT
ncbi:hypothetical protein HBDW_07310 [Herbaspirillum sp. DW155]|uniref:hypothetical protein n=1 Tax=Herbaspirillum sp. DW155 TaxID=3095609 RepID=UPI003087B19F|nr:hypothetical protein HBDW_07310 [Herbaspirillum sp. DW155]